MRRTSIIGRMICITAIGLLLFTMPAKATETEREALAKDIRKLTQNKSCKNDDQCHSVGFGSRACGGFNEYIIYSAKDSKRKKIETKAQRYFDLDRAHNIENNIASICAYEIEPLTHCVKGTCQAKTDIGVFE